MFKYVNRVRSFVAEFRCVNFRFSSTFEVSERHLAKGQNRNCGVGVAPKWGNRAV